MQDAAADPELPSTVPVNPADMDEEMKVEGGGGDDAADASDPADDATDATDATDAKQAQVPSLSDIFFNGGRGSLDLKMSKSEHNPRKFTVSRRITHSQNSEKKTPHRTSLSSTTIQKVHLTATSSKSGGLPVTSEHGSRRSTSFSRRRSHHPDKRKSTGSNDVDDVHMRVSEGDSQELQVPLASTVSTTTSTGNSTAGTSAGSRRRTGTSGLSAHRRARIRPDAESQHVAPQENSKTAHKSDADTADDDCETESSFNCRAEGESNEFVLQVQRPDSSVEPSNHNSPDGENDHHTATPTPSTTYTTTVTDKPNQEGKPRSRSFEQKLAPHKQMSRGDSNSSADNAVAVRPHRASHSTERRRHRRESRPLTNSNTSTISNGSTTSPVTPSNDQDITKRTRAARHGTSHSQSSWTRNLRRMKKQSEEDNGAFLANSTSPHRNSQKEEDSTHSHKLEADTNRPTILQEETNSHSHRRQELDDLHDSKTSEGDKKSHNSHHEQNPITSSGRLPVPSSPSKELTLRRHHSKSFNRASGGNVPVDDARTPPLSQFLDSLLVGNKEKVIVEESILSTETTATQGMTSTPHVDLFAAHDQDENKLETTFPNARDIQPDHQHNDTNMDIQHMTAKGEIHLSGNDKPNTKSNHGVVTNNQGFDHARSPTMDRARSNFHDFGANKDGSVLLRSPPEKICITEHTPSAKVVSTTNQANKPLSARNSMLPKGTLFSPSGRASSMFFDKEAMDQGIKKLANLNLSVTSHGRKKKGLNKFLTTTMKFNKLADGGDSVCLDDLPFAKESKETTRPEPPKPTHLPLDKMFMKSNKDYDDTLNDSGGLSFSMDLAGSEPKSHNKLFSLASQPSRRGLFAKKPKKFLTFDDSGAISFSMDDTHLPKQTWHEEKKETSLNLPKEELSKRDNNPFDRSIFGSGFDLDGHLTRSRTDNSSKDNAAPLDTRKSHTLTGDVSGTSADDFAAWQSPRGAVKGKSTALLNPSLRSKSSDLSDRSIGQSSKEFGEDRGSKLQDLLEQPGHRKISQLAEPSICGTSVDEGKTHVKEVSSFMSQGILNQVNQGKGGLLIEDDENLSTESMSSDKDIANPMRDTRRGIELKDVLNDAPSKSAPSDASVCDQSVMTLEQQEHFLQLNLPGMVGYKSSSSLSVLEHAVEVIGDSTGGRGYM